MPCLAKSSGSEPIFIFKMVRYHGLPGGQRITGGGFNIGTYRRDTDDIRSPTDTGRHQEAPYFTLILQYLAKFGFETFGGQSGRFGQ